MRFYKKGTTLVEIVFLMVIIGLACTALLGFMGVGTMAHREAAETSTATRLAKAIHEYSLTLDHLPQPGTAILDLADLHGRTFTPPLDSRGQMMAGSVNWTQKVTVEDVDPATLTDVPGSITAIQPKRLIVTVARNGADVCTQRWLLCPVISH